MLNIQNSGETYGTTIDQRLSMSADYAPKFCDAWSYADHEEYNFARCIFLRWHPRFRHNPRLPDISNFLVLVIPTGSFVF